MVNGAVYAAICRKIRIGDSMLDYLCVRNNTWECPELTEEDRNYILSQRNSEENQDQLIIFRTVPYIDAMLYHVEADNKMPVLFSKRFVFHEDYVWSSEEEELFEKLCLSNDELVYSFEKMDEIYEEYSKCYPDWKLKRYYTKSIRMLDHIYHCIKKSTPKEILYKAGLDELAANFGAIEEFDLLASKPSDLYSGLPMRVLRALNCKAGADLLSDVTKHEYMKQLHMRYADLFQVKFNDAQCMYLDRLIEGNLTVGETGRLFRAKKPKLASLWSLSQYKIFLINEENINEAKLAHEEIIKVDPIYEKYLKVEANTHQCHKILEMKEYLLLHKDEYNKKMRRANRKRNQDWQERTNGYVVRYPQTINDFLRESVYMGNCLDSYTDFVLDNITTILFMRKPDDVNKPFITIEIFQNRLTQAYHRFNEDCTKEEAEWIIDYCNRHGIDRGNFKFDCEVDLLD